MPTQSTYRAPVVEGKRWLKQGKRLRWSLGEPYLLPEEKDGNCIAVITRTPKGHKCDYYAVYEWWGGSLTPRETPIIFAYWHTDATVSGGGNLDELGRSFTTTDEARAACQKHYDKKIKPTRPDAAAKEK